MNDSLTKKRDELAEKYESEIGMADERRSWSRQDFKSGFDAAVKLLSEAAPEFDEQQHLKCGKQCAENSCDSGMDEKTAMQYGYMYGSRDQFYVYHPLIAARDAIIEDMNRNCISLGLHESRMKQVEADRDKWKAMAEELGAVAKLNRTAIIPTELAKLAQAETQALAKLEELQPDKILRGEG